MPEVPKHILTEEVREWDYGDYEGLLSSEIKEINPAWKIWNDGAQVALLESKEEVREYHRQYKEEGLNTRDVMIIAHGHFNRVLISRWINFPLALGDYPQL
ncbi:hypothetical protein H0H92_003525 [Tricholoma furcatifolium]|nr:hypothetical protein H0H92_003525 [Tricholoma furcatifolium]